MELRDVVAVLWKRRLVVATTLAVAVAASAYFAVSQPKRYESTATVAFTPDVSHEQGLVSGDTLAPLLRTWAATARSEAIRRPAGRRLGRPLPGDVETSAETGAGILRITGKADTAADARDTAGAVTQEFLAYTRGNRLVVGRVIDPPVLPASAVQPRPPLIVAVGTLVGAFAAVMLAFAIEHFRRRVETASDVAHVTNAPVIGRLPRERPLVRRDPQVIWRNGSMPGLQESYRALRTNIDLVTPSDKPVIQVTSTEVGQGKSTVVANLGIALAQLRVPTVIIDADLRRPKQHSIFDLRNDEGLTTAMQRGSGELVPQGTDFPYLSVLTSGPVTDSATELLHVHFRRVVGAVRSSGSLALVDSPPVLPVADARLIAPLVDGVIMVVAARSERPGRLRAALEQLELAGASILGVVLNESRRDAEADYGEYAPHTGATHPV